MRGLTAAAVASAVLAVLSIGAAAVVVLEPFGADEVDAAAGGDEASESATAEEVEYIDLTEGLDPFDPSASENYYAVTWHDLVWVPNTLDSEWDVYYQEEARAVDWSQYVDTDERVSLTCSDIRNNAEFYPDSFDDPEAWYQAELDRYADTASEGDEFEIVSGPTYTHYLIDGQEAILVEYERHWTKYEDSEEGVLDVDWNMSTAFLYIDLPTEAATTGDPVHSARCWLQAVSADSAYYDTGLETLLGVRLWLE